MPPEVRGSKPTLHPMDDPANPLQGVLATRTQIRFNPILVSVVRLLKVEGNVLRVKGLDAVDGSPVLDVKPYIPHARLDPGGGGAAVGDASGLAPPADHRRSASSTSTAGCYAAYGPQRWWPGETPFEVIVGAILTQAAAWTNVEKAIANLKAAGALSPEGLARLDERELARLDPPGGLLQREGAQAEGVRGDAAGGASAATSTRACWRAAAVEELRPLLLATHGIGPETADAILLYAAGRPVFVIDAYTRRLFSRLGCRAGARYVRRLAGAVRRNLEPDAALFNEYHALIVRHGKERCRRLPVCDGCPLLAVCPAGQARAAA